MLLKLTFDFQTVMNKNLLYLCFWNEMLDPVNMLNRTFKLEFVQYLMQIISYYGLDKNVKFNSNFWTLSLYECFTR